MNKVGVYIAGLADGISFKDNTCLHFVEFLKIWYRNTLLSLMSKTLFFCRVFKYLLIKLDLRFDLKAFFFWEDVISKMEKLELMFYELSFLK